jgi:tetratricopeptide (TPR) repeat protein
MRIRAIFAATTLFCLSFANAANADNSDIGRCVDDTTVPPEDIIAACTLFITDAFAETWRLEYVPKAMVYMAIARERLGNYEQLGKLLETRSGKPALMSTVDAMIQANPGNAEVLNGACWIRTKAGEQIDSAIADCNESLRIRPGNAETFDSRAFAYFRAGNFAQAISDANSALAAYPKLATSLYVRGLAKLKSGDAAGGNADIAAAKMIDGKIADTYAGYGVTP